MRDAVTNLQSTVAKREQQTRRPGPHQAGQHGGEDGQEQGQGGARRAADIRDLMTRCNKAQQELYTSTLMPSQTFPCPS